MAVPTDSLRILPLELRQCIYSHLLFDDEAGTTYVRQKPDTEDRSSCTDYMSAVLALPSNVNYDAYRQKVWAARIRGRSGGANDVEEAFLQALCWVNKQHPDTAKKVQGWSHDELIAELIHELLGQERPRKIMMLSHTQIIKQVLATDGTQTAKRVDQKLVEQASQAAKSRFTILYENSIILTPTSSLSTPPSQPPQSLSPHRSSTTLAHTLLPFTQVNHSYRTESLHHLATSTHFSFGLSSLALSHFFTTAPPLLLLAELRHLHVTLVEGYMPQIPALPNMRTLDIELWPRDPTRLDRMDRAWGRQTERLLGELGTVVAVGARIGVEMRWWYDWERFEREFVRGGGWRRGVEGVGGGDEGQKGLFCRRRYELCGGDGQVVVEVRGKEKEVVSADDDGLVSSFGKVALSLGKDSGIIERFLASVARNDG